METLLVANTLANHLRTVAPKMDVFISATDPKEYMPTGKEVTVLIHYCGSEFTATESTDAIVQMQTLHFTATVIVSDLNKALTALDRIRSSLGGIPLPGCDQPLWLTGEKYIGNSADFYRYTLEMATRALFIANKEGKDLPLLTVVNYEEAQ
ncbi:Gp37 family protein [Enterobacter sp.]|uniref:Gp37 family protein n=1 Tax=Enterobacter sp. TaxID=42895 RepID=UPI00296E4EAA|nr:Gp37 family protein [Enterobacter sp.]